MLRLSSNRKNLSFESLEARRMLTPYPVTLAEDFGDKTVSGSLSWAIDSVNNAPTGDHQITFNVVGNQVEAYAPLPDIIATGQITIDGGDGGSNGVTIASAISTPQSNLFIFRGSINSGSTDLTLRDMNLTGFSVTPIVISSLEVNDDVTIENMEIYGNGFGDGAGILMYDLPLNSNSVVIQNNFIYDNHRGIVLRDIGPSHPTDPIGQTKIHNNMIGETKVSGTVFRK